LVTTKILIPLYVQRHLGDTYAAPARHLRDTYMTPMRYFLGYITSWKANCYEKCVTASPILCIDQQCQTLHAEKKAPQLHSQDAHTL